MNSSIPENLVDKFLYNSESSMPPPIELITNDNLLNVDSSNDKNLLGNIIKKSHNFEQNKKRLYPQHLYFLYVFEPLPNQPCSHKSFADYLPFASG
mgnify:CR=1 FL=1